MRIDAAQPNAINPESLATWLALWLDHIGVLFLALIAHLPRGAVRVIDDGVCIGIRAFETYLKALIALRAFARMSPAPQRATTTYPRGAAPGFRRRAEPRASLYRMKTRSVLRSARARTMGARIKRLVHMLRTLEVHVARLVKRLERGYVRGRLLATAPPLLGRSSITASATALVDSS
jgi:hypothetical protein